MDYSQARRLIDEAPEMSDEAQKEVKSDLIEYAKDDEYSEIPLDNGAVLQKDPNATETDWNHFRNEIDAFEGQLERIFKDEISEKQYELRDRYLRAEIRHRCRA